MPTAYDEFPGDSSKGIPAGASAFEMFNIKSGGKLLTVHGGAKTSIGVEEPQTEDHTQWWMLASADEGKYKLITMCKDSVPKRFLTVSADGLDFVRSEDEATPVAIVSDYKMSDAGRAVMKMFMH